MALVQDRLSAAARARRPFRPPAGRGLLRRRSRRRLTLVERAERFEERLDAGINQQIARKLYGSFSIEINVGRVALTFEMQRLLGRRLSICRGNQLPSIAVVGFRP